MQNMLHHDYTKMWQDWTWSSQGSVQWVSNTTCQAKPRDFPCRHRSMVIHALRLHHAKYVTDHDYTKKWQDWTWSFWGSVQWALQPPYPILHGKSKFHPLVNFQHRIFFGTNDLDSSSYTHQSTRIIFTTRGLECTLGYIIGFLCKVC